MKSTYYAVFLLALLTNLIFAMSRKKIKQTQAAIDAKKIRDLGNENFNLNLKIADLQKQLDSAKNGQSNWWNQAQQCFKDRDACRSAQISNTNPSQ